MHQTIKLLIFRLALFLIFNFFVCHVTSAQLIDSKDHKVVEKFNIWTKNTQDWLKSQTRYGMIPGATSFSQVARLHIKYSSGTVNSGAYCTGALISPKYILTAAHCICGVSPQSNWYFDSYSNCKESLKDLSIKVFLPISGIFTLQTLPILHMDYRSPQSEPHGHNSPVRADIALLPLPHPINVAPIGLAKNIDQNLVELRKRPIFISFGRLAFSNIDTKNSIYKGNTKYSQGIRHLSKLKDLTMEPEHCYPPASPDIFCTQYSNNPISNGPLQDAGACSGDSGGPLLNWIETENKAEVFGIASYISKYDLCADSSQLSFFTNIIKYNNWISEILALSNDTKTTEPECEEAPFKKSIEITIGKGQLSVTPIYEVNHDKPLITINSTNAKLYCDEFDDKSLISCKSDSDDNNVLLKINSGSMHVVFCKI